MLAMLRKRFDRDDEGFTLIELMVVVLIIAILLAIAIPTFLGARERAQNRAAQSDIRNALTAEKVFYTDTEQYTDATNTNIIKSIEPSLTYGAAASTTVVMADASVSGTVHAVCVAKLSKGGNSYSLLDIATGSAAGNYYYNDGTCGTDNAASGTPSGSKTGWS